MRALAVVAGAALAAVVGLLTTPAAAAPALPTGTIAVADADLVYGGFVTLDSAVYGRLSQQAYIYHRVVCWAAPGVVVYQAASRNLEYAFPLTDQEGQGLQWDGQAAACQADLVYRVDRPRNSIIETLASVPFTVAA